MEPVWPFVVERTWIQFKNFTLLFQSKFNCMKLINVTTDEDFRYNSSKTVTYIINFSLEFVKRFGCNVKFKIRRHKYSEIAHQIMPNID